MPTRIHNGTRFILGCLLLGLTAIPAHAVLPGCYHTRAEIKTFLDSLVVADSILHIVHIDTIGWSRGDQLDTRYPLYAVTISDNPGVFEDEPTSLIIGQVHAEEVLGMEMMLRFMKDVVSFPGRYSILIYNAQMVFVPTANPDGLEVISRGWDDTWRKNGYHPWEMGNRPCNVVPGVGEDSCGVDLNRNFDFNWIYGDTLWVRADYEPFDYYKGPAPFSEPEAQAIRDLALRINPTVSCVYHSARAPGGANSQKGIVAWAWGPEDGPWRFSPDHTPIGLFDGAYCRLLEKHGSTLVYYDPVFGKQRNGNLQEWFYARLGCLQINTELGPPGDAMQPSDCNVLRTYNENDMPSLFWLNKRLLNWRETSGEEGFTPLTIHTFDAVSGQPISAEWRNLSTWSPIIGPWYTNEQYGSATTLLVQGSTRILLRKEGYQTVDTAIAVSPNSLPAYLNVNMQPLPRHTLELRLIDETAGPIAGRVFLDGEFPRWIDVPNGQAVIEVPEGDYQLMAIANAPGHLILWRSVHIAGNHSEWFTLPATDPSFSADFNAGLGGWAVGGTGDAWRAATDTSAQNSSGTLTTEPALSLYTGGQYANNLNTWAQYPAPIHLGDGNTAILSFWRRGRLDVPFDSLIVEVSSDESTWLQAAGYSDLELPWTQSFVNLSAWAGQDILLRFRFKSDSVLGDYGIHIDNVALFTGTDTAVPERPAGPVFSYKITGAYPNPFNPQTTIAYEVAAPGNVTLVVFNTIGQEVRRFNTHALAAGAQRLAWDGTTTQGAPVSSGLYFVQLQAGNALATHKLMLLR